MASESNDEYNDGLVESHTQDVLRHLLGDDVLSSLVRWSIQKGISWVSSGKSQGGKRVHYHVNPQKLDWLKDRLLQNTSRYEGNN